VTYSRWDVVAVPFPFIEGTASKHRPALIVSTDALHAAQGLYWAVMITTAKAGMQPDDLPIPEPAKAGLPDDCVIRVSRLTTLSDKQIDRKLGTISPKLRNGVTSLLKRYAP
jgi:mRNA interferase MazF